MFFLFTGQPGSKKTANMIHFVLSDDQFKNRPVYFYNIKNCVVPDWTEITEEQVKDWPNFLPEGAVLLIDEAQEIWRPAAWDKTPPLHVTGLEKHRHQGLDILATTQHPMLIHTAVRRQVQQHRHLSAAYGLRSKAMIWEKCVNDPDEHFTKKEADTQTANVPKEIFTLYKSTALNTHKKRVPKKLYMLGMLVLGLAAVALWFNDRINNRHTSEVTDTQTNTAPQQGQLPAQPADLINKVLNPVPTVNKGFQPVFPIDKTEYLALFKPRVDGLPHTAPIYDELQKPAVAPRSLCVRLHTDTGAICHCYTQQATRTTASESLCNSMINQGLFDHTRAPKAQQAVYNGKGELKENIRMVTP